VLPIHPAAELFPLMSPDELRATAEDIRENGLQTPISVERKRDGKTGEWSYRLLDGRNRLDAIELAGFNTIAASRSRGRANARREGTECGLDPRLGLSDLPDLPAAINYILPDDPYAFVASANIHRRHLTAEQKRDLIATLLKTQPEKSDRQIAKAVKASPTFVGKVRAEKEAAGDVSTVDTRIDTRGRKQPAHNKRRERIKKLRRLQEGASEKAQQRKRRHAQWEEISGNLYRWIFDPDEAPLAPMSRRTTRRAQCRPVLGRVPIR
jgi:hypothetical protein